MSRSRLIVAHNGARIFGGLETWTVRLLAALRERGHEVLLCARPEVLERARTFGVPGRTVHLGGDLALHHALRFARLLRREGADALLLSSYPKIWLGGMAGSMARVPRVVARIAHSRYRPGRWKYRTALTRWVHAATANADGMRIETLRLLPRADPRRVLTIYNGVADTPRADPPEDLRAILGIPADAFVVASVARLDRPKRLDRLLGALALLPETAYCIQAGEGPERDTLEALAAELGVAERAHFIGYREAIGDVYDACDAVAVVSSVEGMSNQMLEGMRNGRPVLSTPVSGAEEALDPLPTGTAPGWIVDPSPESIADALGRLRADPELRWRMGESGKARARTRFDWSRMVDQWESLLVGDLDDVRHEGPSPLVPGDVPEPRRAQREATEE